MPQKIEKKKLTKGMRRRQAMIEAATDLFLEKGYTATSLSDIVARSKGSRSTLYEHFKSKEGLLVAIIDDLTERIWSELKKDLPQNVSLEEWLNEVGVRFLHSILAPRAISIYRLLIAEGRFLEKSSVQFFEKGPRTIRKLLSDRLDKELPKKHSLETLDKMAQFFLGSTVGEMHFRLSLGIADSVPKEEIKKHVALAVKVFLNGVKKV